MRYIVEWTIRGETQISARNADEACERVHELCDDWSGPYQIPTVQENKGHEVEIVGCEPVSWGDK